MKKAKLGIIFGGKSTEHNVSIVSGMSILKNLDKLKYEIYPIYIDEDGKWFEYLKEQEDIQILNIGEKPNIEDMKQIQNIIKYLKTLDKVFPVLHGKNGEDGSIQGLFEMIGLDYVGCKVLSSSICMDKVYTKLILEKAKIKQSNYIYIKSKNEENYYTYINSDFEEQILNIEELYELVEGKLKTTNVFVKPSNSGSSVGVNKATNIEELRYAISNASMFDEKILIEEEIKGREIECAILEINNEIKVSCIGEIKAAEEFYSYNAKYEKQESYTQIPAKLTQDQIKEIHKLAIKAFKSTDCKDISRIDFFIEDNTNMIILNEINTMPGFTNISMYPKLWEEDGIKYKELLNKLIKINV